MEKEVKCPWCEKKVTPKVVSVKKKTATVKERRCSNCSNILAAYLEGEGDFLPRIRTYEN